MATQNDKTLDQLLQTPLPKSTDWMGAVADDQKNERRNDLAGAIALRLLAYKRSEGLNGQQLAKRVGVSPQYIGRVLKGKENLSLDSIAKLEDKTGLTLISIHKPRKRNLIAHSTPLLAKLRASGTHPRFSIASVSTGNHDFVKSA